MSENKIKELLDLKYRIPKFQAVCLDTTLREQEFIDVNEVILPYIHTMRAIKNENKKLKDDLYWCIVNSGQLEWGGHEIKRPLVEKYFPEKIHSLAYYNGGDL